MVILLSYLISDLQRSSTYCYRYTAILSFRDLILIALHCLYLAPKGEPRLGIIDKEIGCTLASKHDLVKLVGMTCYLVGTTC